jgi:transcriptional regulator with XRE-family HTH domain
MVKKAARGQKRLKSAINSAFARTLYALRIEKGFSQEELSFRCEIDRSYLGQLERGEKEPCLTKLVSLAAGLETPLSEFFRRFDTEQHAESSPAPQQRRRIR